VLEHLFSPFVTTKPDGTGLGLLSVKVVAEDHQGSVMYERSAQLGGACFRVHLAGIKE
jgi:two-component system sensor histidine kinase HydH